VSQLRRALLAAGVVASLALTADQVRAGNTAAAGAARDGAAPLSLSVPVVVTRPGVWLTQWSAAHVEAASLVLFGLGLFGCAQLMARRKTQQVPARAGQNERAPASAGAAVGLPSRVTS
jgi:hypothetical protein